MFRHNSQKNQQLLTRSEICEFWVFCNRLILRWLQNRFSGSPFATGLFNDLGRFTAPFSLDGCTI